MIQKRETRRVDLPVADLTITAVFVIVFLGGYLLSQSWENESALMPRMVSVAGLALAILYLVVLLFRVLRVTRSAPVVRSAKSRDNGWPSSAAKHASEGDAKNHDAVDEWDTGYVFATAGARKWISALLWLLLFFAALRVLGIVAATLILTFPYVRFVARGGWIASAVYGLSVCAVLVALERLLSVQLPAGIFE